MLQTQCSSPQFTVEAGGNTTQVHLILQKGQGMPGWLRIKKEHKAVGCFAKKAENDRSTFFLLICTSPSPSCPPRLSLLNRKLKNPQVKSGPLERD